MTHNARIRLPRVGVAATGVAMLFLFAQAASAADQPRPAPVLANDGSRLEKELAERLTTIEQEGYECAERGHAPAVLDWVAEHTGGTPYPSQYGLPGWPGTKPNEKPFNYVYGFPEYIPYTGSVEHVRIEWQRYIPVVPRFNAKTLVKNFLAARIPGVDPGRIVDYAEPVYYVPKYRDPVRRPGCDRKPVKVVAWDKSHPPFALELGALNPDTYVVRVIAVTRTENIQRDTKRLVINFKINDGAQGETRLYRKRCAAIDEFYSMVEFFFHAPEKRRYAATLQIDPSSRMRLLVHNIDLHDCLGMLARRAGKKSASLYDPQKRLAAWTSKGLKEGLAGPRSEAERKKRFERDAATWEKMAPLNAQILTYWKDRAWDAHVSRGKAPPLPAGVEDDGMGVDVYGTEVAKKLGLERQTFYPVAEQMGERLMRFCASAMRLTKRYHETGDREVGRDAAVHLARVALKHITEDSRQCMWNIDMIPGFRADADCAFRRRPRDMLYGRRMDWLPEAYDKLFPLIVGNQELAASIGRFIPWIKNADDLVRFYDTYILQYWAQQLMTYRAWLNNPCPLWMATVCAVQQAPAITKPWIQWLYNSAYVYPNHPLGVDELLASAIQRDGTHKYGGAWGYCVGGNFSTGLIDRLRVYKSFGGELPLDLTDIEKFPKAIAMCYFPLETRCAGGYRPQMGCPGSPNEGRFVRWIDSLGGPLVRTGWQLTRDPKFAALIKWNLGRELETDAEWEEISRAAEGRRHPVFELRSRVLADWCGILETGEGSDDFRFRRALSMRVGYTNHGEPLDIHLWAHGVPLVALCGQRTSPPGWTTPSSGLVSTQHSVVSSLSEDQQHISPLAHPVSHRWISSMADTEGARYMEGRIACSGYYGRQVALIDVDEGKPADAPLPSPEKQGRHRTEYPKGVVTPNSYAVDVFRIKGGDEAPLYAFHGPHTDRMEINVERHFPPIREEPALKPFVPDEAKWNGTVPGDLEVTWRMRREEQEYRGHTLVAAEKVAMGPNFDPDSPRKFVRLRLLGHDGADVFGARMQGNRAVMFTFENIFVRAAGWQGETVFPVIIEPFAGEPFIVSTTLLTPRSVAKSDAPVAFEVTTKNGHRDIVYLAPRDAPPTSIPGLGVLSGEFAYLSFDKEGLRQATLVGGKRLQTNKLKIEIPQSAYEGTVKSVAYYRKRAVFSGRLPAGAEGAVIEIGPPTRRTSYTIETVNGNEVTFRKGMDRAASRIESVSGDGTIKTRGRIWGRPGLHVSDEKREVFWKVKRAPSDKTVILEGGPDPTQSLRRGMVLRLWEFGPGDRYRLPVHVNLQRTRERGYRVSANTTADVQVQGERIK